MLLTKDKGFIKLAAESYAITFPPDKPFAYLDDAFGERLADLFVLSGVHASQGKDDTVKVGSWQVEERPGEIIFTLDTKSSVWSHKTYRFRCYSTRLVYQVEVEGEGYLDQVDYFGGYYSGQIRWGSGFFWSGHGFQRAFNPEPNAEEEFRFSPAESSVINLTGVPLPGKADWFFTPPPFCFAVGNANCWLGLGVEARPGANRFTEFIYRGQQTGFYLSLSYEGHTQVCGRYQLPSIGFEIASDEYEALAAHVHSLQRRDYVRRPEAKSHSAWWNRPLVEGFGKRFEIEAPEPLTPAAEAISTWYENDDRTEAASPPPGLSVPLPTPNTSGTPAAALEAVEALPRVEAPAAQMPPAPQPSLTPRGYDFYWMKAGQASGIFRSYREKADWWFEPIYCGWGSQCYVASLEQGRAPDYSRQELYEGFLASLEQNGVRPGIVVLDDKWQLSYGENDVDTAKWPDLAGFVRRCHDQGQKVLLWIKAWDPEGVPAYECITNAGGLPIAVDPTNPEYIERMRASIRRMLSTEGYNADGFKIDFSARIPSGPGIRLYGDVWGLELMRAYLEIFVDEAQKVKPDALVMAHTPHPYLSDVVDMVRLNDINTRKDVQPAMRHRAHVARIACPDALIDTDNWPIADKASWRKYVEIQPELGIPSLYYATHIDTTHEELTPADYQMIREYWEIYRQKVKEERSK